MGLTLLSTTPVVMALVQERAGKSRALANGIYMAINFAISALATVVVGMLADRFGLTTAFYYRRGGHAAGHALRVEAAGEKGSEGQ